MMVDEYRKRMEASVAFLRAELPEVPFIEPKGAFQPPNIYSSAAPELLLGRRFVLDVEMGPWDPLRSRCYFTFTPRAPNHFLYVSFLVLAAP